MPDRYPRLRSCLRLIKPYIPGKSREAIARELGLTDIVKLASNENPLGPSPLALEAIGHHCQEIHYYPDSNGYNLREALAKKQGIKKEQIILGNGSDELIGLLTQAYLQPGEEAVTIYPTFSEYEIAVRKAGGTITYFPLERPDFNYNLDVILSHLTEKTRLVFICSPNNPTGTIIPWQKITQFIEKLPAGLLVVLDEAYVEYVADPGYGCSIRLIKQHFPVISLRTFSKIYGLAGLRIGYAIAPEKIISDLNRIRDPFNVNSLAQAAALAALADEQHLKKSLRLVEKGRRQLTQGLAAMGLAPIPSRANFIFLDVGINSQKIFTQLLKKGIIIRSGDIFGFPTFIRVTIGTEQQNHRFLEALAGILK